MMQRDVKLGEFHPRVKTLLEFVHDALAQKRFKAMRSHEGHGREGSHHTDQNGGQTGEPAMAPVPGARLAALGRARIRIVRRIHFNRLLQNPL